MSISLINVLLMLVAVIVTVCVAVVLFVGMSKALARTCIQDEKKDEPR